jgi:hypothetical protein
MHSKREPLLRHRNRCLQLAEMAPSEAIRVKLLSVARLYEIEVNLIDRAGQSIADSKELIAKIEALLSPWTNRSYAYYPNPPLGAPSRARLALAPNTSSEDSHQ